MKREAVGSTKMKKLCKRLNLQLYMGIGILEAIWHLTAREAPQGDIGKLPNEDIALGIDYEGDSDQLIEALVDSRWLDRSDTYRLVVHDWHEHADDALDMRLARSGKLYANGVEVVRYLSPNQQNGKSIQGHKLRKELKDKQGLNACIMDALLANPQLIPDEWKTGYTYFWGTTFRRADGDLVVGYLCWSVGRWVWSYYWLGRDWRSLNPAAVLAS